VSVAQALPDYHFRERHLVRVAASPELALAAARAVTLDDVPLVRVLFRLRGLHAASRGPVWDALAGEGFAPFDADTLVAVGRPWSPRSGLRHVDDFAGFDEPGWAKMGLDLHARPDGDGSRLETETRVYLTDHASRRRFAAYWLVIRPFSGLVRRSWLKAAKREAEATER
jgi:hypothetical protein